MHSRGLRQGECSACVSFYGCPSYFHVALLPLVACSFFSPLLQALVELVTWPSECALCFPTQDVSFIWSLLFLFHSPLPSSSYLCLSKAYSFSKSLPNATSFTMQLPIFKCILSPQYNIFPALNLYSFNQWCFSVPYLFSFCLFSC